GVEPWTSVGFVLQGARRSCCLAEVLLWQTKPVAFRRVKSAIEACDHEGSGGSELLDLARCDGHAVRRQELRAEPLVLEGGAHVELASTDQTQRKFEDVGGR